VGFVPSARFVVYDCRLLADLQRRFDGIICAEEGYRRVLAIPPEDLPDLGFRWTKYILSWPGVLCGVIAHSSRRQVYAYLARFERRTNELVSFDAGAMSAPELIRLGVRLTQEISGGRRTRGNV
jgi:hypothetical protein